MGSLLAGKEEKMKLAVKTMKELELKLQVKLWMKMKMMMMMMVVVKDLRNAPVEKMMSPKKMKLSARVGEKQKQNPT